MDTSRIKQSPTDISWLGVFLERSRSEDLHTGIVYREVGGNYKRLHLGWYKRLFADPCPPAIGCTVPLFDPTDEQFIALYCARIARTFPSRDLPYNLKIDNDVRFTPEGHVEAGKSYTGLSCATFVVAVFRSAGNPLIDTTNWPQASEEDRQKQEKFVSFMRSRDVQEERAHAEVIASEIGGPRIAPEEVAGACLEDKYPVAHPECEAAGKYVIAAIDPPHTVSPAPHTGDSPV